MHWYRAYNRDRGKYKNPRVPAPEMGERTYPTQTSCTVAGCSDPHKAKGLCRSHYLREYRASRAPGQAPTLESCGIPKCDKPVKAINLCHYHYLQYWRALNPDKYEEFNRKNAAARRAKRKAQS